MNATRRRSMARSLAMAAASLAVGAGLCSQIAAAETIGGVEHFPTKCNVGTLAAGPDGNVWFTCFRAGSGRGGQALVGRVSPQGEVSEFRAGIPAGLGIDDIGAGPDGNLWFTLSVGIGPPQRGRASAIGRMTPAGVVTVFRTGLRKRSAPAEIIVGPGGNLWFTDVASPPEIGQITPQGAITESPTELKPPLGLGGLVAGPDGNVWFTQVFNLPHGNGE